MVNWIWGGCALMALGGLLAVLDRRYRARSVALQGKAKAAPTIVAGLPVAPLMVSKPHQ
jgi:cytochrome c-type biogenesis protein CcmF